MVLGVKTWQLVVGAVLAVCLLAATPPSCGSVQPHTTVKAVKVTAGTLKWFYRLDRRLIDCPPGRFVKEGYNSVYYVLFGKIHAAAMVGYDRRRHDTALCAKILKAGDW